MSANNSASLSSVVVVGDLFRVTLPGESAFRSHKVTKKVEEGKRGGRRRRGNENTRRVPSLRGSMLVVVSDRRTVNEARVGFLSRREDNVLRGGRERRKGKERERKSFSSFTLSSLLHRPLPVFCIRYRICPRPGHRPESVYIYIYIFLGAKTELFFSVGVRKKKKGEKGSSWKIIIPPLDSGDHAAVYRR